MSSLNMGFVKDTVLNSPGTKDFVDGSMGGVTPKLAIVIIDYGSNPNVGVVSGMSYSIGFYDGTLNNWMYANSRDAFSSSNLSCASSTGINQPFRNATSSTEININFNSWLTNGIRLNFVNTSANVRNIYVILLGGSAITNVKVDSIANGSIPNVNNTYDYNCGFQPSLGFLHSVDYNSTIDDRTSFGMYSNGSSGLKQRCYAVWRSSAVSPTTGGLCVSDQYCIGNSSFVQDGSIINQGQIASILANGFRYKSLGNSKLTGNLQVVSIKLASDFDCDIKDVLTSVSNGMQYNSFNFKPLFIFGLLNLFNNYNTPNTGSSASMYGFHIANNIMGQSVSTVHKFNVSTTLAKTCVNSNGAIYNENGSIVSQFSLTWNKKNVGFNYSISGTQVKIPYLSIGQKVNSCDFSPFFQGL